MHAIMILVLLNPVDDPCERTDQVTLLDVDTRYYVEIVELRVVEDASNKVVVVLDELGLTSLRDLRIQSNVPPIVILGVVDITLRDVLVKHDVSSHDDLVGRRDPDLVGINLKLRIAHKVSDLRLGRQVLVSKIPRDIGTALATPHLKLGEVGDFTGLELMRRYPTLRGCCREEIVDVGG